MSTWPTLVLPIDINGTGFSVDPADLAAMFIGTAEVDAQAHWLFGDDNATMLDLIDNQPLVPRLGHVLQAGGSGYTSAPTVSRTGTGQSTPMTMTCTISGGAVNTLSVVDPGSPDATAAGAISFSGGGGSGATAVGSISPAPTMHPGYLSLADAAANSLNGYAAPIDISNNQTLCAIVKRKAAANSTEVLGNWQPSGSHSEAMILLNASGYVAYSRTSSGNFPADPQIVTPPAGSVGDWLFVALTHTDAARSVQWGGGSTYTQSGALGIANALHRRVGVGGSGAGAAGYGGSLDVAELIVFPRALSTGEIANVYARSKDRMSARGLSLV